VIDDRDIALAVRKFEAWAEENEPQFARLLRAQVIEDELGGPGSGHWGHSGNPPNVGGSSAGGGLVRIGAGADSSVEERREQAQKYQRVRAEVGEAVSGMSAEVRAGVAAGVVSCQAHGLKTGNEKLYGVDEKGAKVGEALGNENSVGGSAADDLVELAYATIHNHPGSSSFSNGDIWTFTDSPARHMIIIGNNGTLYTLSKPHGWTGQGGREASKIYKAEWNKSYQEYAQQVKNGANSRLILQKHSHEVVTKTAEATGLIYRRIEPRQK
jgi:hypothetical protein